MTRVSRSAILLVILAFLVPVAALALLRVGPAGGPPPASPDGGPVIRVFRSASGTVAAVALEEYVTGVVAAEMPADFHLEALKAQAIAARTNAVRALASAGRGPQGADITDDHTKDQAYRSPDELRRQWGADFDARYRRVREAVLGTAGQILVYQGKPIEALFFSTSNGYTASAKEVWGRDLPYLQSVPSPWDADIAPRFTETKAVSFRDMAAALHLDAVPASAGSSWIQVLAESPSHRITALRVGDRTVTGNEFRAALGLNSTSFTWTVSGDRVIFRTSGYGHGVGMSQYGAEALARQGKTAEEIVQYYYRGAAVAPWTRTLVLARATSDNP
ncbi:MAG: stage II sporulation protein D [Alicyclobacillaceae bacterium]|nr:stage II sporulation protein D [Alicyclobacillaceae bacterium]